MGGAWAYLALVWVACAAPRGPTATTNMSRLCRRVRSRPSCDATPSAPKGLWGLTKGLTKAKARRARNARTTTAKIARVPAWPPPPPGRLACLCTNGFHASGAHQGPPARRLRMQPGLYRGARARMPGVPRAAISRRKSAILRLGAALRKGSSCAMRWPRWLRCSEHRVLNGVAYHTKGAELCARVCGQS